MGSHFPITKDAYFVRRRDKTLVTIDRYNGREVEYTTRPMLVVFKVSLDGFRRGFRPATELEIAREERNAKPTAVPATTDPKPGD